MTNRELLQKIPDYGELAIRRAEQQDSTGFLDAQSDCKIPSQMLTHAFSWKATKEGVVFWSKILDELREQKL